MLKIFLKRPEGENIYAVLVGIDDGSGDTESLLDELERLLETSGGVVYAELVQPREKPDPRTYMRKRKGRRAERTLRCRRGISCSF